MVHRKTITVKTSGRSFTDLSRSVAEVVAASGTDQGLCNVFLHHTSASLLFCENADPSVRRDLEAFFSRLVPDGDRIFTHTAEGPDDMSAHVRTLLSDSSLNVPVVDGRPDLGTWQGIYLWEHRSRGHTRRLTITVLG